jgi:2-methylisocitrate lyase-like PEP mutase family enzyme
MPTQWEKGLAFRALHSRADAFIIPNPWDAGTARLLAHLGFEALATTSAGCAFGIGQADNTLTRDQAMAHASVVASATDLPVSGDLENGFGDDPEYVAETVRLAATAGLVGASIEDMTRQADSPIYEKEYAAERIRAAAEAARGLPFAFTLTARAENYLAGRPDLADTVARLQAYQEAGADVLYAPGLPNKDAIAAVVSSVDRPVNVVVGLQGTSPTLAELSALGVRRVSTGSAFSRVALGAFLRAARAIRETGDFGSLADAVSYREINTIFAAR